jgi:hypothetical protein
MSDIRDLIEATEQAGDLPPGDTERFAGWGVMGLPFASGHILGLRRFARSPLGPGYTALWHRSAQGEWRFYSDAEPRSSCSRYFGLALREAVVAPIELQWDRSNAFSLRLPDQQMEWSVECNPTPATRAMNGMARMMPEAAWRNGTFLKVMGPIAGTMLRAGHLRLQGDTPNRQWFIANPRQVWAVSKSNASLSGESFGDPGAVHPQAKLGDFWIPQRGLVAIGDASFEPFDASRHSAETSGALTEPKQLV